VKQFGSTSSKKNVRVSGGPENISGETTHVRKSIIKFVETVPDWWKVRKSWRFPKGSAMTSTKEGVSSRFVNNQSPLGEIKKGERRSTN